MNSIAKSLHKEVSNFSSCKMNKIKERSYGENHSMAVSDQEKVKIKSVFNG